VTLHLQLGSVQFTVAWRLYLSRKQVHRLNRARRETNPPRLTYHSLVELAEAMLDEIAPHLPKTCRVYVLFDSWYDGRHLERFIQSHGWHWICATKSNRVVNDRTLSQWWTHLGHTCPALKCMGQRITSVVVRSTTRSRTYATRYVVGRLRRYPEPVVAIISKRARRDRHPAYFLCSDTTLSVRTILKYYGYRWQTDLPEVLAAHQHGHLRQTVCYIAALARRGQSDAKILADLMPT